MSTGLDGPEVARAAAEHACAVMRIASVPSANPHRVMAALALAAALTPCAAPAQPHMQTRLENVAVPTPEPDVWLRRLVGQYELEGMVEVVYAGDPEYDKHRCGPLPPDPAEQNAEVPPFPPKPYCSSINGKADCVAVGTGPGVQCVLNAVWQDIYTESGGVLPGGVSYLSPAMALFGLDPGSAGINYLLVDHKGLPEGGIGFVKGNRATFTTECVNAPVLLLAMDLKSADKCERTIYIDAKPDSRIVNIAMVIDIRQSGLKDPWTRHVMTLRRVVAQDATDAPSGAKQQ